MAQSVVLFLKHSVCLCVCVCEFVSVCPRALVRACPIADSVHTMFGPRFIADKGESEIRFLFSHHFSGALGRVIFICKYEKF